MRLVSIGRDDGSLVGVTVESSEIFDASTPPPEIPTHGIPIPGSLPREGGGNLEFHYRASGIPGGVVPVVARAGVAL